MARLPKRMVGPVAVSNVSATLYTAPSYIPTTLTSVVRHIHIQNPSASPVTFTLSIGADAAGTRIFDAFSIPAAGAGITGSVVDYFCHYVLTSGQTLVGVAGTNNILTVTINGEENVG